MKRILLGLMVAAGLAWPALATDPVKIGLVLPLSGPFAAYGKQIDHGVRLYLSTHGDMAGGRQILLITKDDSPGTAGDVTRRLAQELVVKDHVDILAGFGLTPAALATAPLATEAQKPMVIMNAATSAITAKSPNIVRTSMTLPQNSSVIAAWAAKNGIRKVFTLVADYGPGFDAESQFKKTFLAAGGTIVDSVRSPVATPDYGPFLQRIKDAAPDAVFLFLPSGAGSVAFMKGFAERGLAASGVKLISTGDLTDEENLDAIGEPAVGLITAFHYSAAHPSPANAAYVAAYTKAYPGDHPNFMSVGGYDGMALIAVVLEKTKGSAEPATFIEAAKGMAWESPRGPISVDPATRDIIQTIYIRRVERVGGVLQNVEFDSVPSVKDPGKE